MFRKIVFSSVLAVAVCVMFSGTAMAAVAVPTFVSDQTGAFTMTVGGTSVKLKASTNVYVTITLDDETATTSAVITAVNSKGSRLFAMDSDGGPLYYKSTSVGTAAATKILSTTGTDNVAAATGWSAL